MSGMYGTVQSKQGVCRRTNLVVCLDLETKGLDIHPLNVGNILQLQHTSRSRSCLDHQPATTVSRISTQHSLTRSPFTSEQLATHLVLVKRQRLLLQHHPLLAPQKTPDPLLLVDGDHALSYRGHSSHALPRPDIVQRSSLTRRDAMTVPRARQCARGGTPVPTEAEWRDGVVVRPAHAVVMERRCVRGGR